jgi:acetylornithine/N-succinyldiaminopimelate aminotransferase
VPTHFLKALRQICDDNGLLLLFDEVQTGIGRTGHFFGYQRTGVAPDVMGLAKGLGGGFPIGACLATAEAGKGMTAGTHGSTFGGNPMATTVGNAVLDVVLADGFLEKVQRSAISFRQRLAEIKDRYPTVIKDVRGEGLLIGLGAACPNGDLVSALRAEKVLSVAAGDNVVRFLPPLIIEEPDIAEAITRLDRAAARVVRAQAAEQSKKAAG